MDMIYTNASRVDQGVLAGYKLDMSFGESENDFEMTMGADEPLLDFGAFVYSEGTEYGGIVDTMKTGTNEDMVIYYGRTWHGVLNSKVIQPDTGAAYLIASGEAHTVLSSLISRLGLTGLFVVEEEPSGINIPRYQFNRYCKAYDGIRAMLAKNKAKLKFTWKNRSVCLSVETVGDYTDSPVDGDVANLTVKQSTNKVNHLICLGKGELANREVVHLYVDQFGRIGTTKYYKGTEEITEVYDYSFAESSEELKNGGIEKLQELRNVDTADITIPEEGEIVFDIGDIVGATERKSGVNVSAAVAQKIINIENGVIHTEYKTGS